MKRSVRRKAAIVLVGATAALGVTAGPLVGAAGASQAGNAFHSCSSTAGGIGNAFFTSYYGNGNADNSNGIAQYGWGCYYF